MASNLSHARLRAAVTYDPNSGRFFRDYPPSRRRPYAKTREVGFSTDKGYRHILVDGRRYIAHRLAWFWMTGNWPPDQVDHIDGNKANNAWVNLRQATNSQNQANTKTRRNNRAGLKGAHYLKASGKWTSRVKVNGSRYFLGLFDTPEQAHAAYAVAAGKYFGKFARAS